MAKVIKLTDNSNVTLIPVTDANYVQMTVDDETKSVYDVILEDEEVTAAAFNNLNDRLEIVEAKPGLDATGTLTGVTVNGGSTTVSNGIANIPIAANGTLGVVALGYTDANKGYALKLDSNGRGYVNVPWVDTTVTLTASGTKSTNNVVSDVVLTKSGNAYTLTMTYTSVVNTDEKVKNYSSSANEQRPILFSYTTNPTSGAASYVASNSAVFINPSSASMNVHGGVAVTEGDIYTSKGNIFAASGSSTTGHIRAQGRLIGNYVVPYNGTTDFATGTTNACYLTSRLLKFARLTASSVPTGASAYIDGITYINTSTSDITVNTKFSGTDKSFTWASGEAITYSTEVGGWILMGADYDAIDDLDSQLSSLSSTLSTLQTTGIKLYGTTTKGPASNVAYTNGLTYIYSNGTTSYTIPAALSVSGENEVLETGDTFTYLSSSNKWIVMDNNKDIATNNIAGTIKLYDAKRTSAITPNNASSTSGKYYKVELDSNNKAFVNVPWTDNNTDVYVKYYSSNTNASYPVLFSYAATPTNNAVNYVSYDSTPTTGLRYNPNTNTLYSDNVEAASIHSVGNITADATVSANSVNTSSDGFLKRGSQNALTIANSLVNNEIIVANASSSQFSYVGKSSGYTIAYMLDAAHIAITYNGVTNNLTDTIIENEEVTAAALTDLDSRILAINKVDIVANETSSGLTVLTYTINGTSTTARVPIATNSATGVVMGSTSSTSSAMGVNVGTNGAMTVAHYSPSGGTATSPTNTNVGLIDRQSTVLSSISITKDSLGHVTGIASTSGTLASYILETADTRSINDAPYSYKKGFITYFKSNSSIGLNTTAYGSFSGLIEFSPWSDTSGGPTHELAFTSNGHLVHRISTSTTAWGSWERIAKESDTLSYMFVGQSASNSSATTTNDTTYILHARKDGVNSKIRIKGDGTWTSVAYNPVNSYIYVQHSGPSVTGATVGPAANKTLAASGQFAVPKITFDNKGHITSASTITYTLPADANDKVKVYGVSDNTNHPLLIRYAGGANASTSGDSANYVAADSNGLTNSYYNPAKDTMYVKYSYSTAFTQNGNAVPSFEVIYSNMTDLTLF